MFYYYYLDDTVPYSQLQHHVAPPSPPPLGQTTSAALEEARRSLRGKQLLAEGLYIARPLVHGEEWFLLSQGFLGISFQLFFFFFFQTLTFHIPSRNKPVRASSWQRQISWNRPDSGRDWQRLCSMQLVSKQYATGKGSSIEQTS